MHVNDEHGWVCFNGNGQVCVCDSSPVDHFGTEMRRKMRIKRGKAVEMLQDIFE